MKKPDRHIVKQVTVSDSTCMKSLTLDETHREKGTSQVTVPKATLLLFSNQCANIARDSLLSLYCGGYSPYLALL